MREYEDRYDYNGCNPIARKYNPDKLLEESIIRDVRGEELEEIGVGMWAAYKKGQKFLMDSK